MMCIALSGSVLVLSPLMSLGVAATRPPCADRRVTVVDATPGEAAEICAAMTAVVRYFADLRFQIAPPASVIVRARRNDDDSTPRMHGYFDAERGTIVVTRSRATAWGLEWSPQITGSVLRHEFVHAAVVQIMRSEHTRLRREWHELIAYAVQIALMESQLRDRVLAAHAEALAFHDLTEVNEFTYGASPDRFAVASYRTYLARGGPAFVKRLLRFEVVPPPISYPFPVLPSEIGR